MAKPRSHHPEKSKYGYLWVTLALFLISFAGHWGFGWPVYVQQQEQHGEPVELQGYLVQMTRDTLENWQSEFLQLIWQVAGLAWLWYVGSPASQSEAEKEEAKLDAILRAVNPEQAERILKELEEKYPSK